MKRSKNHLPVLGYGPHFILAMAATALFFLYLIKQGVFDAFQQNTIFFTIIGVCLIIIGSSMYALSLVKSRIGTRIKNNELVVDGIYAYVRNPLYSGLLYLFIGILCLQKNWIVLLVIAIFWASMTIFLKTTEEKWLLEKFGDEYRAYMRRVNRCLLWFKKKEVK